MLSLGFERHGLGRFLPYRALYEVDARLVERSACPTRLHTLTTLALALLAAAGAASVLARLHARRGLTAVAGAALVAMVLAEGAGFAPGRWYPHPEAPRRSGRVGRPR